ncbi:hypothetical protein LguiA_025265 [Lonicera macranthoides]
MVEIWRDLVLSFGILFRFWFGDFFLFLLSWKNYERIEKVGGLRVKSVDSGR